jgi:O-antigen/teichoic acid export membrane protein
VHLRPPSIALGVQAFLWAFVLGLIIWLGMLALGVSGATAFILSVVSACAIFLYVRLYGGNEPRRYPR